MRRVVTSVAVALLAVACGGTPDAEVGPPAASGSAEDAAPSPSPSSPPSPEATAPRDAAWEHLATIDGNLPERAAAAVAGDAGTAATLWGQAGFSGAPPELDFDDEVLLLLGQADDACPDELVQLEVADGGLAVDWLMPPGPCEQPLIFRLHAVRVHRAVLGEGFSYALPEPFTSDLEPVTIELPPYTGEAPPAPQPPSAMTDDELDAVFVGHPVARCGPEHEVIDFGPAGERDERPVVTIEEANGALASAGFDIERDVVPFVEWSTGGRLSYVVAAADEDAIRQVFADAFGDRAPDLRVTPWAPAEVHDAMQALQPLLGGDDGPGRIVWAAGAPGPVSIGMIDPTREALDAIAEVVDPSLVCVTPELSGVHPADG